MTRQGSIRSLGKVTTVSMDTPTSAAFRQLAGDMPVSHYLRALAQRELKRTGKGTALPGMEREASEATLAAISEKVSKIDQVLNFYVSQFQNLEKYIDKFINKIDKDFNAAGQAVNSFDADFREMKEDPDAIINHEGREYESA